VSVCGENRMAVDIDGEAQVRDRLLTAWHNRRRRGRGSSLWRSAAPASGEDDPHEEDDTDHLGRLGVMAMGHIAPPTQSLQQL
jgi:hypothetical protein